MRLFLIKQDGVEKQITREEYIELGARRTKNIEFAHQVLDDGNQKQLTGEEVSALYDDIASKEESYKHPWR